MKIKGFTLSLLIPGKWGFLSSGSAGAAARGTWCTQTWGCAGFGDVPTHSCGLEQENRCWHPPRKVRGYRHPGEAAVPRGRRGTEGSALGSAAHQLLPLQTELLSSSASVCPEIRASSLRVTWVCLPLCLAQMNLCGAGCQECIPIPGACWGDAVAVLPTNQFGSWIQSAFSWRAFKTLHLWDGWQHVAAFLGARGLLWAGNG